MSDIATYCRSVETYLCQKNQGHLIRLVGPAFEMVRGWAEQGVPLKVVMRGIDTRVGRLEARGGRRRPLHIEFCEGDVLREFDGWRLAVGSGVRTADAVAAESDGTVGSGRGDSRRPPSLPKHLTRVLSRLTALLMAPEPWRGAHAALDASARALGSIMSRAATARGAVRAGLVGELPALDAALTRALRDSADTDVLEAARREATQELEPFRERMPAAAFAEALERAIARQLRERVGAPRLSLEP